MTAADEAPDLRKHRRGVGFWSAWASFVIFLVAREVLGAGAHLDTVAGLFLLAEAACLAATIWSRRWTAIALATFWLIVTALRPL